MGIFSKRKTLGKNFNEALSEHTPDPEEDGSDNNKPADGPAPNGRAPSIQNRK